MPCNNKKYRAMKGRHSGLDDGYMGMIHEDHSQVANLPQQVVQKTYPKNSFMDDYYLDDTIRGVDENLEDSKRKIDEYPSDSMY